ncbi:MAG: class II fumarate hydratase [Gammaproteobacteria bacterium]|nr:class II fumarate hydratase [Pseudomonadales bacterium]MCP5348495.1 class II fumarate hydratase [Pseudomonadales bacterium]
MTGQRTEKDSLGEVTLPGDCLWGAQSQRSLQNFAIGSNRFPSHFIHDFALVKLAAARANAALKNLEPEHADLIEAACREIISGQHDDQFPLSVWQTGSGTQTNMNLNEVIANLGNLLAGNPPGSYRPLHPNDHVNRSQSSNDVFPTVMHLVAHRLTSQSLLPALAALHQALTDKEQQFSASIKSGRTHMMDATPVTLGQEFGAWRAQMDFAGQRLRGALEPVRELAIGGTAVGTGLNTPAGWAATVVAAINDLSGGAFRSADNRFSQLASHDALLVLHGELNLLATQLYKMASDLRLMNSGPRCGLSEISIPANEPGSSIMPGKVNPTQIEALTMVCLRVMGNNSVMAMAGSQGQFQLNVYKPVIIHTMMESLELLSDAMTSFTRNCLSGIEANQKQLSSYTERSLMLVTALSPHIGYDRASKAAAYALDHDLSLREAVTQLELLSGEQYDELVRPADMLGDRDQTT